jgi:HEAT repeat protein
MTPRTASNGFSLGWFAAWVLLLLALAPAAVAVEGKHTARLAAASDAELAAELASAESALMRFVIAEEMARRRAERFTHLWDSRMAATDFADRLGAGLVLARAGDERGLELVLTELAEATADVEALPKLGPPASVPPLEHKLHFQRSHHRRYLAALTLGLIGDARAVDPLIEGTRDPGLTYRAAMSLGEIGDRRAIPALREMARAIPKERHWAGWALAMLGERDGWDLLIDVATGSDLLWDQRRHAIVGLGELEDPIAVEPLARLLNDNEVHLRVAAARALGQIGDPAALPALRTALGDEEPAIFNREPTVAVAAAEAIRRIESPRGPLEGWSPPPGR